jgi:protein involved in polysaccharide export with SLBB domain
MHARLHWPAIPGILLVLALLATAVPLTAQQQPDWDARRVQMSRAALEDLLASYEEVDRSSAYSDELRARARQERALVRSRLESGDFRVGDRITLQIQGESELSREYVLEDGPVLRLPEMGEVELAGVLRSELEEVLARHLSRYFHDTAVRATSTIRISVTGSVGNPGFLVVESRRLITDVLTDAGGLSGTADIKNIRIERGRDRIWTGEPLHSAIIEGRTLDELSLRAGDHIVVPGRAQERNAATWAFRILTPGFILFLIQKAF